MPQNSEILVMARKNGGKFSLSKMGSTFARGKQSASAALPGAGEVVVSSAADLGPRYGRDFPNMCDQCGCAQCSGNARCICPSQEWLRNGELSSPILDRSIGRPGQRSETLRVVPTAVTLLVWTQIRGTVRLICERVRQTPWHLFVCIKPQHWQSTKAPRGPSGDGTVWKMMVNYCGENHLRQSLQKRKKLKATMVPWRIKPARVFLTAHNNITSVFVTIAHAHYWQEVQVVLLPTASMPKKLNKDAVRKVMRDTFQQLDKTARDIERGGDRTPNPHGAVAAVARMQSAKEKTQKEQEEQRAADSLRRRHR